MKVYFRIFVALSLILILLGLIYCDDPHLFIGLSILAGSCLIALAISFGTQPTSTLYRSYHTFKNEIANNEISREDLAKKVGTKESYYAGASENFFSGRQKNDLDQLIYEGKIVEKDGLLSLPN